MFLDRVLPFSSCCLHQTSGRGVLGIIALALSLGLVACDSNGGGPPPSDLEGTYEIQEMRFIPFAF